MQRITLIRPDTVGSPQEKRVVTHLYKQSGWGNYAFVFKRATKQRPALISVVVFGTIEQLGPGIYSGFSTPIVAFRREYRELAEICIDLLTTYAPELGPAYAQAVKRFSTEEDLALWISSGAPEKLPGGQAAKIIYDSAITLSTDHAVVSPETFRRRIEDALVAHKRVRLENQTNCAQSSGKGR